MHKREAAPGHVAMVRELVFDHLDAAQVEQLERICSAVATRAAELDGAQPGSGPSPNS